MRRLILGHSRSAIAASVAMSLALACVYTLAPRPGDSAPGATGEPNTVSVELRVDDATAQESGFRAGDALAAGLAKQLNGGKPVAVDTTVRRQDGWDYQNALPDEFLGR